MNLPILYTFRRCPYAIRARMALYYAGINVIIREVILKDKPQAMLTVSPKGTVPILVLPNGDVLDESRDIMVWALSQRDSDGWYIAEQHKETDALITMNDTQFKPILDNYKYPQNSEKQDPIYYRNQAHDILLALDKTIEKSNFLLGERMGYADVAIFPFIRQFAMVDKDWFDKAPYANLQVWLGRFLTSGLFNAVMKKYPAWEENTIPIVLRHS